MARGRKASPAFHVGGSTQDSWFSGAGPREPHKGPVSKGMGFGYDIDYGQEGFWLARSTQYDSMNRAFSEYKRDSIVGPALDAKAYFSTNKGFTTGVEPESSEIKTAIDAVNKRVDFDNVLREAVLFTRINGLMAYYIFRDEAGLPTRLLPLRPWSLEPVLSSTGDAALSFWRYSDVPMIKVDDQPINSNIPPKDILYFLNSEVLGEYVGFSEVERVLSQLETRRYLNEEAFKESVKSGWAPIVILVIDTGRADASKAKQIIKNLVDSAILAPGKIAGVNQDIKDMKIINMSPDLDKLSKLKEELERDIIGNFKVPKFLLNREQQVNRATSYSEARLFIEGEIAGIQRQIGRQVEARWYDLIIRAVEGTADDGEPLHRGKHTWNPVTIEDYVEMVDSAVKLKASGLASDEYIKKSLLKLPADEIGKVIPTPIPVAKPHIPTGLPILG